MNAWKCQVKMGIIVNAVYKLEKDHIRDDDQAAAEKYMLDLRIQIFT